MRKKNIKKMIICCFATLGLVCFCMIESNPAVAPIKNKSVISEGNKTNNTKEGIIPNQIIVETDKLEKADEKYCIYQLDSFYTLQFPNPNKAKNVLKKYRAKGSTVSAEPVKKVQIINTGNQDYEYLSYGPELIGADKYSEVILANTTVEELPEIVVGVVDSGIDYNHPFFEGRLLESSYDFIDNDEDVMDENGHGTHVAGIIVDTTLPNVKIMPYKASDKEGYGSEVTMAQSIEQAVKDGVDVINISMIGEGTSSLVFAALDKAIEADIVVCVGAGNDNKQTINMYPACYADAITVAAVDSNKQKADYSNYGGFVDVTAPGTDVNSAYLNGCYQFMIR